MYEGYEVFEIDTGSYGADALVIATDGTEAMNDFLFCEDIAEPRDSWATRQLEHNEICNYYDPWKTSLGELREYPGWQDAGQTGEAPWTGETPTIVFANGSAQISEVNGYIDLCPAPEKLWGNEWIKWLAQHYRN